MGLSVLWTGGLGDVIALESVFTAAERDSLEVCFWATKAEGLARPLFERSRRYRHVRHVTLPAGRGAPYFSLEGVRADHPSLPPGVEDWSILRRFKEHGSRPWARSTFLEDLGQPGDLPELARPFVAVTHQTTLHTSAAQRALRDLDAREWARVLGRLEAEDLRAVVLNGPDSDPPPDHPRVIDMRGRLSFSQSLEVLTRASGYWGIASALCVAAAQLFGPASLWVKGPESWLQVNRHVYFAPHPPTSAPFLFNHLCDRAPALRFDPSMVTLVMQRIRPWRNQLVGPGSLIEAKPEEAETLIRTGQAVRFEAPAVPEGPEAPALDTADRKPPARKATRAKSEPKP